MGYYRPRPVEARLCKHCGMLYETNHKRTLYCGESCRQLAYQARQGFRDRDEKTGKGVGELEFSLNNVAVIGAAVLAADTTKAIANALLDIQPTNTQIMAELKKNQQRLEHLTGILSGKIDVVRVITTDVRAGVGAIGTIPHKAIIASQKKRKGLPPGDVEPFKFNPGR